MTATHRPYWNTALQADYCDGCGDDWPCLPWRQSHRPCKCSHGPSLHTHGDGQCWVSVCGCRNYRPQETT